jgi:hypothetical protein
MKLPTDISDLKMEDDGNVGERAKGDIFVQAC